MSENTFFNPFPDKYKAIIVGKRLFRPLSDNYSSLFPFLGKYNPSLILFWRLIPTINLDGFKMNAHMGIGTILLLESLFYGRGTLVSHIERE